MNETRRKELEAIIDNLVKLYYELDHLRSDELEAYDNLSESLQQTEKAEMMVEAADKLMDASEELEYALTHLENAKNC